MDRWNRLANLITLHTSSKHAFGISAGLGGRRVHRRTQPRLGAVGHLRVPIITLLMVIVLQHTQNRDTKAVQLKLNELLLALEDPDSQIIHAGKLGDAELDRLDAQHTERARLEPP